MTGKGVGDSALAADSDKRIDSCGWHWNGSPRRCFTFLFWVTILTNSWRPIEPSVWHWHPTYLTRPPATFQTSRHGVACSNNQQQSSHSQNARVTGSLTSPPLSPTTPGPFATQSAGCQCLIECESLWKWRGGDFWQFNMYGSGYNQALKNKSISGLVKVKLLWVKAPRAQHPLLSPNSSLGTFLAFLLLKKSKTGPIFKNKILRRYTKLKLAKASGTDGWSFG